MPDKKEGPSRVACGIVAILIGSLGIHKFMLGLTTPGIIQIVWRLPEALGSGC